LGLESKAIPTRAGIKEKRNTETTHFGAKVMGYYYSKAGIMDKDNNTKIGTGTGYP
jgi:hypothetical protein